MADITIKDYSNAITIGEGSDSIIITPGEVVGTIEFIDQTDTPATYTGNAGKFLIVNDEEDALEFVESEELVDWGDIGGTLSNQTDLQAALDLKYDSADFNGDFDTRLATKDTGDLTEGTNLYFTEVRGTANFDANMLLADTDDLSEGSTNNILATKFAVALVSV